MDLELRTDNGTLDLFGDESIVQTLSIFNLDDISSRYGEYSNVFKLPLTNNNIRLIEYANIITTINTTPYQKIACNIYVKGSFFKNGFIEIENISDIIEARFYSGNSNFYNLLKQISLQDLDWSDLDHVWNYTNAYNSCINSYDYFYPVMDYNGQTLAGDILDIRKVLPATRVGGILTRLFTYLNYNYVTTHSTASIDKMCIPYSQKNPTISAATLLYNSVDVQNANNYTLNDQINATFRYFFPSYPSDPASYGTSTTSDLLFDQVVTAGSSSNYSLSLQKYTAQYSGTYNYDCLAPLVSYDTTDYSFYPPIGSYDIQTKTYIVCFKTGSNGIKYALSSVLCATGQKTHPVATGDQIYTVSGLTITPITDTLTGNVVLQAGDILEFELRTNIYIGDIRPNTAGGVYYTDYTNVQVNISSEIQSISTLTIDLDSELVFGGLITYSSLLPNIKCSDFIKDLCVREGLILSVDEDTKTVTSTKIDNVLDNIQNSIDWSDKLDESELPNIKFKIDKYAQNNWFKHAEDKTNFNLPPGCDFNLIINNQNLELEKTIYTSPFAATETRVFNGENVAYISLYNVTDSKFGYDVKYRILYYDTLVSLFKVTDGTTTSGYINTKKAYFIDDANLEFAMGLTNNLMPNNSQTIIDILQDLKLLKLNINLNTNDIKNINFLYPIYIRQLQSYFFISSVNQFNYTNKDLTEVELIKLNQ